jgi:O-glycosyl hydrolase
MNPDESARVWKRYIEPLANEGVRLGSPSIASTDEGLNWLQAFLNAGCHVDFLALHWYGRGVDNFIRFMTNAHQRFGRKPVWVTEFACTSWNASQPVSQQEINEFLHEATEKLDRIDWIERYAWFGAARQLDRALGSGICLIDHHGRLSQLGIKYMNG